ncbi:MAG: glyoxalase/bleomycin resistance protein/dioxygenase [bacterium]|nr:MAG: glyoxalase/bleomycin resistance protein/dioxygenase [bacterium]
MNSLPIQSLKAHISLNVSNVKDSIEFYKKLFGIEASKVRTGYAKFDVANPPLNLALNQIAVKERGVLSHLGIQVASTEDVMTVRQQWLKSGLTPRDEMQTNCCYAIQDKTWVQDPDGNEWEVFVVLQDNLAETAMCTATAMCGVTDNTQETELASNQARTSETSKATVSCCGTSEVAANLVGLSKKS